jgi:hypothetical protein
VSAGANKTEETAYNDRLSEYLAWLMDSSIQIGPVSFGLDGRNTKSIERLGVPIIGLIYLVKFVTS